VIHEHSKDGSADTGGQQSRYHLNPNDRLFPYFGLLQRDFSSLNTNFPSKRAR
jgi:hypothetical protein